MTLDTFIAEFGAAIGIPGLALDPDGQCQLAVEDVVVDLLGDRRDGRLVLSCLVGEIPMRRPEAVMRRLLDANCMLLKTAGATLGVPAGSDAVVLSRAFDYRRETAEPFSHAVAAFAATVQRLRPLLVPGPEEDAVPADGHALIFRS